MSTTHPKLIRILIDQTPRAMVAMLIVTATYFLIFIKYIPAIDLVAWSFLQIILAALRMHNIKSFEKNLLLEDEKNIGKDECFFITLNLFQASTWTISSILVTIYAPEPYELVSLLMIIGIITAATLSMSSLHKAYLTFFFAMIIPQIIILLYHGKHQHLALIALILIYIPATILLSKSILYSRISSIKAHDELEKNTEKFRRLSTIDNLTDIYNRRYFFEISQDIILSSYMERKKASLLMIDVDHFKKVNDNYGHHAGDFILMSLVKEIEAIIRKEDIFARIGGEEFAILLNHTSLYDAKSIAEKIRISIENEIFYYNTTQIKITLSIGLSDLNEENTLIEHLYKKADQQLYIAKKKGRNRVCY
ncbi:GGDEF domain-containing protein [Marinomonas flavescens]|uniref:GGDEF domain-containing protein n=1 Tax=Marinomonas flavescens TaxID=2529379 RepID=UPI0014048BE8|nr:GGDEF domain-containing protein [Marinomonas flavescens]